MATYKTSLADRQLEVLNGGSLANVKPIPAKESGASLLVATADYTLGTPALVAGDFIEIAVLPPNVRVIPELSSVSSEAMGTELTLSIGTTADDDCYLAVTSVKALGTKMFTTGVSIVANELTTGFTSIRAKVGTATALTSGKKLKFSIVYAIQ